MLELPLAGRERRPPLDLYIKQDANTYACIIDRMLPLYRAEGRPWEDPLAWVKPDAPELAADMRRETLHQLTQAKGGISLCGTDGRKLLDEARLTLIVATLYKYLEQAKALDIDLMGMWYDDRPKWVNERLDAHEDWISPERALYRFKRIEEWRAERLHLQWEKELADIPEGTECLEIGCGSGFFTREVIKHRPDLHWKATDLPRSMPIDNDAELNRNVQPWFTQCVAGEPLSYTDASQDAIFVNNVLHHVEPALLPYFLGEAERVLRPGGKLYVTEEYAPPLDMASLQQTALGMEGVYSVPPAHFSQFIDSMFWPEDRGHQRSPEAWQQAVEPAGFKLCAEPRVVGTFGTPGLPVMEACMVFQKQD